MAGYNISITILVGYNNRPFYLDGLQLWGYPPFSQSALTNEVEKDFWS